MLARAYLWLGMLEATVAMAVFCFVLNQGGWEYGEAMGKAAPLYLRATTACLAAIVVAQVVNVFACRHHEESVLRFGLTTNRLLLLGVAAEGLLILLIVYTPLGNAAFGTAPLSWQPWALMIVLGLTFGMLEELRKAFMRRRA